jgi:preprotein translocase subunit SecD
MYSLLKSLIVIFGMMFLPATISLASQNNNSVVFQIIQNQIVFDKSTVESATITPPKNALDSYSVNIKLKHAAGDKLNDLTQANIGKQAVIMLNDKAISSTTIIGNLGGEFLLTGLTKEQANKILRIFGSVKK